MTGTARLNLAIVEDDSRYRESLRTLFTHARGFKLDGCFGSASEALQVLGDDSAEGPRWDLVLMDIELPGISGIAATRLVKARSPETLVVMLTVFEQPAMILEAICAGADGYLLKKSSPQELLQHLQEVAAGGSSLTAGVARTVLDLLRRSSGPGDAPVAGVPDPGLTPRELDVLRGLVKGLAYKQVAGELEISIDTVRMHIRSVYRKLQVHSVAGAVSRAIRERLV